MRGGCRRKVRVDGKIGIDDKTDAFKVSERRRVLDGTPELKLTAGATHASSRKREKSKSSQLFLTQKKKGTMTGAVTRGGGYS